jgi:hypothetical protein
MALISHLPAQYQGMAENWIPPGVLSKLSPAELLYRCKYAAEVRRRAKDQPPEQYRHLHAHARKVLGSESVADYIKEQRRFGELERNASARIEQDADGNPYSIAGIWREARRKHADDNVYPPGLETAADMTLLGKPVLGDPELAAVAEAAVNQAGS